MMNVLMSCALLLLVAFNVKAIDWKEARIEVQTLFNNALSEDDIYNASWAIYSPSKKIDWEFAGGQFSSGEKVSGAKTFSAAEEFAYNFKHLGRATIIGQPSKGGQIHGNGLSLIMDSELRYLLQWQ